MIRRENKPGDPLDRTWRLTCDKCRASAVTEHLPHHMEVRDVATWARAKGWGISHIGAGRFDHWCPGCEELRRFSAGYLKRIRA